VSKRLSDGERKLIKSSRNFSMFKNNSFEVEAERADCDTPFIHLTIGGATTCLTDVETLDLIDRLQRALDILPSSK
jgi:hypothetical protein